MSYIETLVRDRSGAYRLSSLTWYYMYYIPTCCKGMLTLQLLNQIVGKGHLYTSVRNLK